MVTRKIDAPVSPITGHPLNREISTTTQLPDFDEIPQQNQLVKSPELLQKKSDIGKGFAWLIPGCLILFAGIAYLTMSFKTARNFDDFSQDLAIGNILIASGVVILCNALVIFGSSIITFIHNRRHNL